MKMFAVDLQNRKLQHCINFIGITLFVEAVEKYKTLLNFTIPSSPFLALQLNEASHPTNDAAEKWARWYFMIISSKKAFARVTQPWKVIRKSAFMGIIIFIVVLGFMKDDEKKMF